MAPTALDLARFGVSQIVASVGDDRRREHYEARSHNVFAPNGVDAEYRTLQSQASIPLIRLAVHVPVQRLRFDGVRSGDTEVDKWLGIALRANRILSRQSTPHTHGLVYGYGLVSVWPSDGDFPIVRVEDPQGVYLKFRTDDPLRIDYAVKLVETPASDDGSVPASATAWLYTDAAVRRFEGEHRDALALVDEIANPLGRVPFEVFAPDRDANGNCVSMVDALIPQQCSIDTMRFNLLLAAQFAAWRQRIITGFDPVRRDVEGKPVQMLDENGEVILDETGTPKLIIDSPGNVGVDRLMAFPGADTKVFDLEESDLGNYVQALDMLVAGFAATAQVPAAYLAGDFKNISGDTLVAAESTLRSHVAELQVQFGDAWLGVCDLILRAAGRDPLPLDARCLWADASPRDLAQIASAASQMVPNGAPISMFLHMVPGATPEDVEGWLAESAKNVQRALGGDIASLDFGPKATAEEAA